MLTTITSVLISIACILYIAARWKDAVKRRDIDEMLKPLAGLILNDKKRSAFWYLFK